MHHGLVHDAVENGHCSLCPPHVVVTKEQRLEADLQQVCDEATKWKALAGEAQQVLQGILDINRLHNMPGLEYIETWLDAYKLARRDEG